MQESKLTDDLSNQGMVSIIVPVYNAAQYLEQLFTSIFAQIYSNFEVIVAYEEASTDSSWEVLRHLQERFNFILTTGSERCPGGTRNRGLEYAKGEFVVFVDADDYLMPDYLSSMLSVFSQYPELSVVSCDYVKVSNSTMKLSTVITNIENSDSDICIYDSEIMIRMLFDGEQVVMPWIWMVKRDYLLKNNIQFPTEYYGEDDAFSYSLAVHTLQVGKCNKKVYLYIPRETSVTNTRRKLWCDPTQSAYHYIPEILSEKYHLLAKDYENRLLHAQVSCPCDAMRCMEYLHYLKQNNISCLKDYTNICLNDRIGKFLFNRSPILYYVVNKLHHKCQNLKSPLTARQNIYR